MSSKGQNTQKGIFAQNWAALSLFLQFLKDPNFSYIQLEPNNSEDFDLVFSNGKKIICESKYRLEKFSYSQLKQLLEKVVARKSISDQDEILVICRNVSENLISSIKNIRFLTLGKSIQKRMKKRGLNDQLFNLMPRVNFWALKKVKNNELNYSLVSELINLWIPDDDIRRFTNDILQNNISQKAIDGAVYSRLDFDNDVIDFRTEVQNRSDFFNKKNNKTTQFSKLESDVNKGKGIKWGTGSVSAFSTRWDLMSFAMDRLKSRKDLNLKNWDALWQLNQVYYFAFGIFTIFENNLGTDKNRKYILNYIKKHSKKVRGFYRSDYFNVNVVRIVVKIIESDNGTQYLNDAFLILKELISFDENKHFYLKSNESQDEYELGEITKLLHKVYTKGDTELKRKVFTLLITTFNITHDEGDFNLHTSREAYEIIKDWLDEDFSGRFEKLVKIISNQYDRFYLQFSKKTPFSGWEHMGGTSTFSGSHYRVTDRHFVLHILEPAIQKLYDTDHDAGWAFIKQKCISPTGKVNKYKPDFLNRSVYKIVLQRYASSDVKTSKEAFLILKEFILSRKGVPHKSDLIYQNLVGLEITDDKKWRLVELTTKKFGLPVSPFVQQLVADVAKKGHKGARSAWAGWFDNPKYYQGFLFEINATQSIRTLINDNLDLAIELSKKLITSDHIKSGKGDRFGAYDIATLLSEILQKDYDKGLPILRSLEAEESLSKDQQIIYTYSLFNHLGNDNSDNEGLLIKIYSDVIDPFLKKHDDDITKIQARIPWDSCREAFVKFASRLATKKKIAEAVRILKVFVNDPNPYLPENDPEDPKKYNEHQKIIDGEVPHSITSVRGWCGWVLMQCSVLDGRQQIPELVTLSERLANDVNYYVIHMSCFSLSQLARNRLTVLPSNRDVLFFNDDKATALRMSKHIEEIAFNLLEKLASWPQQVQKAMATSVFHIFEHIRALNQQDSMKLMKLLISLDPEALKEGTPLMIYFAEFRKETYKDWRFSVPGLYDDLGPDQFDPIEFKKIVLDAINKLQQIDPDHCFQFASSMEHAMREGAVGDVEMKKYTELALEYFDLVTNKYGHHIFTLIYGVIEKKLAIKDQFSEKWLNLFMKCLNVEAKFYVEQKNANNLNAIRWHPSLYHAKILELIYTNFGQQKFMQAAKIFFNFPKECELYESDELVSIIKALATTDKEAKEIIKILIDRNPSKYWDIGKTKKHS